MLFRNWAIHLSTSFIINTLNTDFTDAVKKKEPYTGGPVFVTEPDKALLNKWKNIILMTRRRQEIEMEVIEAHEKWALELMDELRKTYHLK